MSLSGVSSSSAVTINPRTSPVKEYGFILSPKGKNYMIGPVSPESLNVTNAIYKFEKRTTIINKDGTTKERVMKAYGSIAKTLSGNNVRRRLYGYKSEHKKTRAYKAEMAKRKQAPKPLEGEITKLIKKLPRPRKLAFAIDKAIENGEDMKWSLAEKLPDHYTEAQVRAVENAYQEHDDTRNPEKGYNITDPRNEPPRANVRRPRKPLANIPNTSKK